MGQPFSGLEGRTVTTYRQLKACLELMNDEQLDANITVEDPYEQECYAAELRIADTNHDSLDDYHPVIYMGSKLGEDV
jgi:hypothetical protein